MPFGRAGNSLSLLTQEAPPVAPPSVQSGPDLQLDVRWGSFRQSFGSSVRALVTGPVASKKFLNQGFFRDCRIDGRIPRRAVVAAALWHIVFLAMPWPQLPASPRNNPAFENFQLTWSGPINDLPPLKLSSPATDTVPSSDNVKAPVREGGDAFHPRQHIFTDTAHPTHPRQTLINTVAPAIPPKILPRLPNIVLLQSAAVPAKPRMEITEQALAQLHPNERRVTKVAAAPLPDVPDMERAPSEIMMEASSNAPARPKLELNAGAAPRLAAKRASAGDVVPAPEVGQTRQSSSNENVSTLIALSATPGPPVPIVPPQQGNLAARVSISPEGTQRGSPHSDAIGAADARVGSAAGGGAGKDSTTVSISSGNPAPKTVISGLGGNPQPKIDPSAARGLTTKIDPRTRIEDIPQRTGPPNFAALPPGAKPEQVFASKKIYTLYVNMPNLNSATGSWVLNFSELRAKSGPQVTSADLAGPVPIKKNDPKYPPTLINEHVEGEVVLYAVIRGDGSVDSVELVRGIDEQLDANAMEALSQWKFRPASRDGTPVDLEAIVHIPFRAPSNDR